MENDKERRPSWDEYFLEIVKSISKRATCDRGRSGCVIVKDKRILATGYVGSPIGLPHCDEVGHIIKEIKHENGKITKHCLRTTHAELNAICQAARFGISIEGSTIYLNMEPCFTCAKAIINAGIKKVVAIKRYHDVEETRKLLKDAGVELVTLTNEIEEYKDM